MKLIYSFLICLISFTSFSQRGKNGSVIISTTNSVVNVYTPLTLNATIGSKTITVLNSASYTVGDLVFIIQMQGAVVNAGKDSLFPDVNSAIPTNTTFGAVTNYYNSGNNEYAEIYAVPNSTTIVLDCGLKYNYDYLAKVQVIKVPRFLDLTISGVGSITCPTWNGSVGGVAVIETQNNCTLSSTPSFSVTGKGFRGGALDNTSAFGGNKFGSLLRIEGAYKGESIAGDTTRYKVYSAVFGRGSIANGGGGGCMQNSGGGGGSNAGNLLTYDGAGNPSGYAAAWNLESAGFATHVSSGGGRGGYTFSSSNQNPLTLAPGNATWSGDNRRNVGGYGGHPLDYTTGKLFLGGGGGAGEENNNFGSAGANGGGMVYIVCYGNLSGAGTIEADGGKGPNTGAVCSGNEGAGGGGGGGTIILNVNGSTALTAGTALSAKGGDGGSSVLVGCFFNTDAYGPGGGGGGGYIGVSGVMPTNSVAGGLNGVISGNTGLVAANFPPNGATRGGAGSTGTILNYSLTTSPNQTVCANQSFTVSASSSEPSTTVSWYTSLAGAPISFSTSPTYVSPGYALPGTYTLYAGVCPGTYRQPIIITVTAGLSLSINSPTICSGQTTTLSATGATSYTWSTGPTTTSITVNPIATTIYTITGSTASCAGTQTTQVTVNAVPTVTVTNPTICSGNSSTLTVGGATTYSWSTGQTTNTIIVSPASTTSYSVTGTLSLCSNTAISTVSVVATPTISLASQTICAGQTATFTGTGATTYTWLPGSVTGSTYTLAPASSTIITVTGANSTCTTQATASLTIGSGITIAVNSPTICSGQTATLTASGATTYTWSTGPTTNSIVVSPVSSTIYTISGSVALCVGSKTTQVTVNAVPTVTVTNPTICSGNSSTLTVGGAATYSWSTGQTTNTIIVSLASTTSYSVTGTLSLCSNTAISTVSVVVTPTISLASQTICAGQTATFTGTGATTYTWLPGSVTGTTYTLAPASSTIITVTGANSTCTTQATASLTIGSGITIAVNSPTICSGQTTTLTASGATTYTWSTGPTTNSIVVSPIASTIYTISGNVGLCAGSKTTQVTVNTVPTVTVTNPTICSGNSSTLTVGGATTYSWSTGQTTNTILVSPASTTSYSVTGTLSLCSNTAISTVSVVSTPTISLASQTICAGLTATFTGVGATTYTWLPGSFIGSSYTIAPATSTIITVTGANSTCTTQATASLTIGSGITISVNSATICSGQTATLIASGATSYTWSSGPTTNSITTAPITSTIYTVTGSSGICSGVKTTTVFVNAVPSIAYVSPTICSCSQPTINVSGVSSVTVLPIPVSIIGGTVIVCGSICSNTNYTVTGTNGTCLTSTIIPVYVNATPTISVNSSTICSGQTATLIASGAATYSWNTGATVSTINPSPLTNTSYTVTGYNGICSSSLVASVLVNTVTVTSSTVTIPICANQSITLSAGISSATTYTWSNGCATYSQVVTPTSTTIYTVNGNNGSCPALFSIITVSVNPLTADFSGINDLYVTQGNTLDLYNTSNGATNYLWEFCNGTTSGLINQTFLAQDTGYCCIKLIADNISCKDSVTKCFNIISESVVIVPNVFTPNGDTKNDVFTIKTVGVKSLNCMIFDRWGLKLYEWDGVNGGWDGSSKNGITSDGSYFYILVYTDYKDKTTKAKGYFQLFKN